MHKGVREGLRGFLSASPLAYCATSLEDICRTPTVCILPLWMGALPRKGGRINLNQVGAQLGAPNEFSSLGLSISQPKRGVAPHRVPRASLSWQGLTDAVTFIHRFARALTWHLAPGYPSRRTCGAGPVVRGACVCHCQCEAGNSRTRDWR